MYSHMSMSAPGSELFALGALHALAALSIGIGLVFLVVLAVKIFSHKQLKSWGWLLFLGGIVVCLSLNSVYRGGFGMMKMKTGDDMRHMSMKGMSMMLDEKTGDDFDKAFIEMMIPHHQGAIDMANDALESASHAEIKNMAKAIISSQQEEIDSMQKWYTSWGYEK